MTLLSVEETKHLKIAFPDVMRDDRGNWPVTTCKCFACSFLRDVVGDGREIDINANQIIAVSKYFERFDPKRIDEELLIELIHKSR